MEILNLLFPKKCFGCGLEGVYLCDSCISKVREPKPVCPECERPSIDGFTHVKCRKKYGLDGLISVWNYEGVVRKAILALKYKYATDIVEEVAGYLFRKVKKIEVLSFGNYYLIPIPLYWHRENTRGFNQSEKLGKVLAVKMGWNFEPELLSRKKVTTPQVELKGAERKRNVKGVFSINSLRKHPFSDCVLFDDVYTTGSTLKEAAKVLKRSGVLRVWGLTVAK